MWRLRRYFAKLYNLFRRDRVEQDLAREMAAHLALVQDDFERLGMTSQDAELAAKRSYGGVEQVKELHRDERSIIWLEQTLRDLRYACRNMARNPGFTLAVVLTLTLGIGVNATLFSAYNAVALKPLPVADPNRVVRLERWFQSGSRGDIQYAFSYPEYRYCQDHNDVFSSAMAASWPRQVLVEAGVASIQLVSANYFAGLGVNPHLGRTFLPEEDRVPGADAVAVLSYPFWQRRFHADNGILGKTIKINGAAFTIAGVASQQFSGTSTLPQVPDLWVPLSVQTRLLPGPDWLHDPNNPQFQILAHLKDSIPLKRAEAQSDALIRQFATTFEQRDRTISTTLGHTAYFGNTDDLRFKAFIAALMLLVGSVLLVACVNVGNMLLARGAARHREIGVRLAVGAGRSRIVRQLLCESLLLALLGGAGGLLASLWATKLLWISIQHIFVGLFPEGTAFTLDLSPDARVFGYALGLSLMTGVLFGLSPALQFSRPNLTAALKDEGTALGRRWSRSRVRGFLIAVQVAISLVLLISTGLLLRGMLRSQAVNPGFKTHGLFVVSGDFGSDLARSIVLERRLISRLQNSRAVKSAALGSVPMVGTWTPPIVVEGSPSTQAESAGRTLASYASDTYFNTLGIPLLRGRSFTQRESENGAHVAIISESAARHFWPAEDPIGKRFKLDKDFTGSFTEFEVVGIAKNVRFTNLTRTDPTHVYLPTSVADFYGILLRADGNRRTAEASVRAAVEAVDKTLLPSVLVTGVEQGPLHLQKSLAQTSATYAGVLACVSLLLAAVGIYGVMAFLVSQRVREIGLRVALGATRIDVLKLIAVEGLKPALAGAVAGITGAAALSWILHRTLTFPGSVDFFYGIPFYDPLTFLGLAGLFTFIAGVATFAPARRALRVDAMVALRCE